MSTDTSVQTPTQEEELTRNQIYYARHREEKRAKVRERYHNRPDVVEKRAERERRKEEKQKAEAETKRLKQLERDKKTEQRNQIRLAFIEKKAKEKEKEKEKEKTHSKKSAEPSLDMF